MDEELPSDEEGIAAGGPRKNPDERKARKPKAGSISREDLVRLAAGIQTWDRKSFQMIGPKGGVLLAVPKSKGVSRAYFYAAGDYNLIPDHPAIRVYQPDERKERKMGGVMAELDFSHGTESALEGLELLLKAVRENQGSPKAVVPAEPSGEE